MLVLGVDFTSAPRRAKPITVAHGILDGESLVVERVEHIETFAGFEALLRAPGPWVGGFDFPFGLPRELVVALGWPTVWSELIRHFATLDRATIAQTFDAFRAARPVGRKYAHRAGDAASRAHSPMKLVNPPVAWMLHAGSPRLLDAGVHLPALHEGDRSRVALEAYPGLLMRMIAEHCRLGRAPSYKNDARAKQTAAQRDARVMLLQAMRHGEHGLRLKAQIRNPIARAAVDDGTGDTIDAIAAAVQAAWGALRSGAGFGLPADVDRLEGWIVSA
jgi:hypothetical protein